MEVSLFGELVSHQPCVDFVTCRLRNACCLPQCVMASIARDGSSFIDINTASQADLVTLPGISRTIARRIVYARRAGSGVAERVAAQEEDCGRHGNANPSSCAFDCQGEG